MEDTALSSRLLGLENTITSESCMHVHVKLIAIWHNIAFLNYVNQDKRLAGVNY